MTRQVDFTQPLSDSDREYLHARGLHARVAQMDEDFPAEDAGDVEAMPNYSTSEWTLVKLQAEVARLNQEYAIEPPLSDAGTKAEIIARLTEWWGKE